MSPQRLKRHTVEAASFPRLERLWNWLEINIGRVPGVWVGERMRRSSYG